MPLFSAFCLFTNLLAPIHQFESSASSIVETVQGGILQTHIQPDESELPISSDQILNTFIESIPNRSVEQTARLFAINASIITPGGPLSVKKFLEDFYTENTQIQINVINIFSQSAIGRSSAAYLRLSETKKTGDVVIFPCAAIIDCSDGLIQQLTIIFDVLAIYKSFPHLFNTESTGQD